MSPTRVQPELINGWSSRNEIYSPPVSAILQHPATRKVCASESQKPLALPNGEAGFQVHEGLG